MKKIIAMLLIMVLVTGSCGSKEKVEEKAVEKATEEAVEALTEELGEDVDVETKNGTTTITTEDGGELVVATDLDSGVPVPEDYPKDVLPIYSEDYIALATKTEAGFSLSGYTNDSMAEVIEYYEDVISDGTVMMKEMDEEFYMNMGEHNGQTYSITIGPGEEDTGYQTNFTLVVMPTMGTLPGLEITSGLEGEAQEDSKTSDNQTSLIEAPLVIPAGVEWPEDYPDDKLPIYPIGATEVDIVEHDGDSMMVGLKTIDSVDHVYDYYKELFSESTDFTEMNMPPMIMLDGTIDDQQFTITVIENGVFTDIDLKFKTLIQIVYY